MDPKAKLKAVGGAMGLTVFRYLVIMELSDTDEPPNRFITTFSSVSSFICFSPP